ncbi:porin family protein [Flavobacterium ardleyense]|uniref:Porin family protein n=1 Tax=Flavobacterium ardleyense TaxID=2038737 RepID=A0ABW5ZCI3_9FLAO
MQKKIPDLRFGAKVGVNFATFVGEDADDSFMYVGFNVGFFAEIPITEKLIFQPEILYSTQGAKSKESAINFDIEATLKFEYINIPLMFKYEVAKNFSLEAGPYVGFLTRANLKVKFAGYGSESENFKNRIKSTDFGLGLGMNYDFTNVIFANVRYQAGLTEFGDLGEGSDNVKNSVFQLGLGFRF